MTQTYAQIQKKIAKLQKEADALRQKEMGGVIARIKVAIEHYGLTAEHLFNSVGADKPKTIRESASGAKYSDGNGQGWSGRGPRPRWLREAIVGGASLESFLAMGVAAAPVKAKRGAPKAAKAKRRPSTVLYQDGAGNSWTGRGPQPRWLKEALARGKTLEDLKG